MLRKPNKEDALQSLNQGRTKPLTENNRGTLLGVLTTLIQLNNTDALYDKSSGKNKDLHLRNYKYQSDVLTQEKKPGCNHRAHLGSRKNNIYTVS